MWKTLAGLSVLLGSCFRRNDECWFFAQSQGTSAEVSEYIIRNPNKMTITATMIKELRERTGAGMMDCKKALVEIDDGTDNIIELAIEHLRKKGAATAQKKAGRIAAEGIIVALQNESASVLVEVNSETDFVAKDASFQKFSNHVAQTLIDVADNIPEHEAIASVVLENGDSIEVARQSLIAKVGENISVRRFARIESNEGVIGCYLHGSRIGVLVALSSAEDQAEEQLKKLGRDIAMHIAASKPLSISVAEMDRELLDKEEKIFIAQAQESGKPADIIDKMVEGRIGKFLKDNTLLGQPFVKNPEQTVGELIKATGVTITKMVRFEVGEGIEKRSDDFVAEVMTQAGMT